MTKDDDQGPGLTKNTSPEPAAVNALPGYLLLYIALYSAYGTESAYLPAFLGDHGLSNEQIGLALAAGTPRANSGWPPHWALGGSSGRPQAGAFARSLLLRPDRLCLQFGVRLCTAVDREHGPCRRDGLAGTTCGCSFGCGIDRGTRISVRLGARRRLCCLCLRHLGIRPVDRSLRIAFHHCRQQHSLSSHDLERHSYPSTS